MALFCLRLSGVRAEIALKDKSSTLLSFKAAISLCRLTIDVFALKRDSVKHIKNEKEVRNDEQCRSKNRILQLLLL